MSVPDGCLLVQAGKQLERLTGGHVLAGFHEVRLTLGGQSSDELEDARVVVGFVYSWCSVSTMC